MPGAGWRLPGPEPGSQAAAADGRRVWARERQDGCGLGGQSQGAVWDSCRGPGAWVGAPELLGARPGLQGRRWPAQTEARAGGSAPALSRWRSGTEPGLCPLTGAQSRRRPQPGPVSPPPAVNTLTRLGARPPHTAAQGSAPCSVDRVWLPVPGERLTGGPHRSPRPLPVPASPRGTSARTPGGDPQQKQPTPEAPAQGRRRTACKKPDPVIRTTSHWSRPALGFPSQPPGPPGCPLCVMGGQGAPAPPPAEPASVSLLPHLVQSDPSLPTAVS